MIGTTILPYLLPVGKDFIAVYPPNNHDGPFIGYGPYWPIY